MNPQNAYKYHPVTGNPLEQESEFKLVDTETGQSFYITPRPTANAIITNGKNEVLLTKRAIEPHKGTWDLPGGFVNPEESFETALKREVKEELNVTAKSLRYFGSYTNRYLSEGINYYISGTIFLAEVDSFQFQPADDVAEARFFAPDNIPFEQIKMQDISLALRDFIGHA